MNESLYQEKINVISNLDETKLGEKYFLDLDFYGVQLRIHLHTKSKSLYSNELEVFFPASWKKSFQKPAVEIHFLELSDFYGDVQKFESEELSDCLVSKIEKSNHTYEVAVQRDFVAKTKDNLSFYVITSLIIGDGFFNSLRWIMPRHLLGVNKLLLHSSCVVDESGFAHFFLGPSGFGKTTTAIASAPRLVLGDDMNLVIFKNNQVYASSGAFGGAIYSSAYQIEYPVKGFYWLKKDSDLKLTELSSSKALLKLSSSACNIFWGIETKAFTEEVINLSENIVSKVSFYELSLKKDSDFWTLINTLK